MSWEGCGRELRNKAKTMTKSGSWCARITIGDPKRLNVECAASAYRAVTAFRKAAGIDIASGIEDAISELMFALAHLADREGCDFGTALLRAKVRYERVTTARRAGEPNGAQFVRVHIAQL
jgi:hypothetical protein